jgi:hypothetical protein
LVDAANVVGSRPNGWWRDRAKAAATLCADLAAAVAAGRLSAPVVVVLEGAARPGAPAGESDGLRVVHAERSGDDAIATAAADGVTAGETVTVVTADRELRERVLRVGGEVAGPTWLLDRLRPA